MCEIPNEKLVEAKKILDSYKSDPSTIVMTKKVFDKLPQEIKDFFGWKINEDD